jgi:hypothetical protein
MRLALGFIALIACILASPHPNNDDENERRHPCFQCKPLPEENFCDITTSCVNVLTAHTGPGPSPLYCACRGGYKSDPLYNDARDVSVQFRLPWVGQNGRVFVRPGVKCDTLCDHWELGAAGCQEVRLRDVCM